MAGMHLGSSARGGQRHVSLDSEMGRSLRDAPGEEPREGRTWRDLGFGRLGASVAIAQRPPVCKVSSTSRDLQKAPRQAETKRKRLLVAGVCLLDSGGNLEIAQHLSLEQDTSRSPPAIVKSPGQWIS